MTTNEEAIQASINRLEEPQGAARELKEVIQVVLELSNLVEDLENRVEKIRQAELLQVELFRTVIKADKTHSERLSVLEDTVRRQGDINTLTELEVRSLKDKVNSLKE